MKLALHKAFRQVGASQQDADTAAESIDSALEKRMNDKQAHLAKNSDMYTVRTEMAEMKSQIAGVRSEVGMVRAELRQEIALVRGEIATVRAELKQDIASVRGDIANVRGEMSHMRSDLVRWIIGSQVATIGATTSIVFGMLKYLHP
ncbi:hypothetical protein ACFJIX_28360 [Roseateles sp. UC29_93]|uniref:hypothetical protein n=1 Tax=Roseateles sp. UC29_93 TaxID=3350177 RepID=UPI0003013F72